MNQQHSIDQYTDIKYPHLCPVVRVLLDDIRRGINDKIDGINDSTLYPFMQWVIGKISTLTQRNESKK